MEVYGLADPVAKHTATINNQYALILRHGGRLDKAMGRPRPRPQVRW